MATDLEVQLGLICDGCQTATLCLRFIGQEGDRLCLCAACLRRWTDRVELAALEAADASLIMT